MTDHTVAHLAGPEIQFNAAEGSLILRQRCSWCGALLIDIDLARIAVPIGQEPGYPTWQVGAFVEVAGDEHGAFTVASEVEWQHPQPAPENACLRMPLMVTA